MSSLLFLVLYFLGLFFTQVYVSEESSGFAERESALLSKAIHSESPGGVALVTRDKDYPLYRDRIQNELSGTIQKFGNAARHYVFYCSRGISGRSPVRFASDAEGLFLGMTGWATSIDRFGELLEGHAIEPHAIAADEIYITESLAKKTASSLGYSEASSLIGKTIPTNLLRADGYYSRDLRVVDILKEGSYGRYSYFYGDDFIVGNVHSVAENYVDGMEVHTIFMADYYANVPYLENYHYLVNDVNKYVDFGYIGGKDTSAKLTQLNDFLFSRTYEKAGLRWLFFVFGVLSLAASFSLAFLVLRKANLLFCLSACPYVVSITLGHFAREFLLLFGFVNPMNALAVVISFFLTLWVGMVALLLGLKKRMAAKADEPLPLVSIIIPVYNGGNFLAQAIDSALGQTYPNIEVIVVNDGSNDDGETRSIAESYLPRIRYYEKENSGSSSAINYGIGVMTGDFFVWLSHDDYFAPTTIENRVAAWKENGSPDNIVFFSKTRYVNAERKPIFHISAPSRNIHCVADAFSTTINGTALLIPRKAIGEHRLRGDLIYQNDFYLWLTLISEGVTFQRIDDHGNFSRVHKGQITVKNSDEREKGFLVVFHDFVYPLMDKKEYWQLQSILCSLAKRSQMYPFFQPLMDEIGGYVRTEGKYTRLTKARVAFYRFLGKATSYARKMIGH